MKNWILNWIHFIIEFSQDRLFWNLALNNMQISIVMKVLHHCPIAEHVTWCQGHVRWRKWRQGQSTADPQLAFHHQRHLPVDKLTRFELDEFTSVRFTAALPISFWFIIQIQNLKKELCQINCGLSIVAINQVNSFNFKWLCAADNRCRPSSITNSLQITKITSIFKIHFVEINSIQLS